MNKEENIVVKDGISTMNQRQLIKITKTMAKGINEEEFIEVLLVYEKSAKRLLGAD